MLTCLWGMVHIKEPLQLIGKRSSSGGFPLFLYLNGLFPYVGARCSSVVRPFAHVRWVVGSILPGWTQCSTTGVTKAVVCIILSVG